MMNATTGFLSRATGRPVDRARRLALALGAGLALAFGPTGRAEADGPIDEAFFETRVRPILAGTCFRCHGGQKVGGGLRVDGREALLRGGESGAAVELDQADESLLLQAVRRIEGAPAMPPDAPLPAREVEALTAWVRAGAPWPRATARFESAQHWAFQPIRSSAPPQVADAAWLRTSVDPFIRARQEAARVSPAPEADRRTLIRRLTYDLTGLPPTPDEVAAFERDSSPHAYEALVDRLLASPRYGEHWGRHWLDVVRYADTAGENSDHPLPHAWRYRNWVIQAFNRRLPFDQFLQEQLAGDLLGDDASPGESHADRVVATGYLALARRFGHDIDKDVHLTYEDAIDTLGKSVLGLTLGCARCHDHKYDPLTTRDYYGLYGIFASTRLSFPGCEPNQQPRDLVPLLTPQEQDRVLGPARRRAAALEAEIKRRTAELSSLGRDLDSRAKVAARLLSQGVVPDSGSRALVDGAAVDLGRIAVRSGDLLLLSVGPRGSHGADSTRVDLTLRELGGNRAWSTADLVPDLLTGNPSRPVAGDRAAWFFLDRQDGLTLLPERVAAIDGRPTLQAWRNGDTPSVFVNTSDQPVSVWTSLPPRAFFLHPGPRGAVALAWAAPGDLTLALDGRVADAHPGGDGVDWRLELVRAASIAADLERQASLAASIAGLRQERQALEPTLAVPVGFAAAEGTPADARIQKRGDPADLGAVVPRKFLDVLGGRTLTRTSESGRRELAQWLTGPTNPLTARVIANRVWQWHFGRGIVATPNDFGTRGAPPSHPELLDHLANGLVAHDWRLDWLHREILLSSTYRCGSDAASPPPPELFAVFPRRRLTAEELRDTLLAASGTLDTGQGGPHPFPPESTWSFTQHNPFAAEYPTSRRSVYVMQKRNRRSRFLALFDGPDPNASTALRDVTTVPTQALFFLNDPFVHEQAAALADRTGSAADRLDAVCRILFGRAPTDAERQDAEEFLAAYASDLPVADRPRAAWTAWVRVLLASNEFLYVD